MDDHLPAPMDDDEEGDFDEDPFTPLTNAQSRAGAVKRAKGHRKGGQATYASAFSVFRKYCNALWCTCAILGAEEAPDVHQATKFWIAMQGGHAEWLQSPTVAPEVMLTPGFPQPRKGGKNAIVWPRQLVSRGTMLLQQARMNQIRVCRGRTGSEVSTTQSARPTPRIDIEMALRTSNLITTTRMHTRTHALPQGVSRGSGELMHAHAA